MANINHGAKRPLTEIYGEFYSPDKILSYGKPLNISVGSRSIGKSTGWAIKLLSDYTQNKKRWCYVRRDKDEVGLTAATWFDNAFDILRDGGWEPPLPHLEKGVYYDDDKNVLGYAVPLALQHKYKSVAYTDVWWEVYDEFLPMNGRYLGGAGSMKEVECIMSLYQTLDRGRGKAFRNEVKIVCVGNAYNYYNPIFIHYGVDKYLRTDTRYLSPKKGLWVVEQTRETEATKKIKTSFAYRLSTDTTKSQMYDNMLLGNAGSFIQKVTAPMHGLFNIIYEGVRYGVYLVPSKGKIYVCQRPCETNINICATTDDHKPNYLMIRRAAMFGATAELKSCFERGDVIFDSGKSQYMLYNYMLYV